MTRRGTATLPLHSGAAPSWLFDRMVDLADAILAVLARDCGSEEVLARLADPYWFQAFGCALGFDWHSSGLTTTTMGAVKEALDPQRHGLAVCGGKGATARRTPDELAGVDLPLAGRTRDRLVRASRLSASVDNACVQDRYELYHHTMVVDGDGQWAVVQQGMGESRARRYHWAHDAVESFVDAPQAAICSQTRRDAVIDLTAENSDGVRDIAVDLAGEPPARLKRYVGETGQSSLAAFGGGGATTTGHGHEYRLPDGHGLSRGDLSERAIDQLAYAYERDVDDFEGLVDTDGVGLASLRALALLAELLYDAEASREDPAKFAFAHGGKDGIPHPVDRPRYDRSVDVLEGALEGAELDRETRQSALDRLASVGP